MDALTSLRTEMDRRKVKNAELAKILGVSKSLVTMWLKGERSPGLCPALLIQRWSRGRIPASAWLDEEGN